MYQYGRTKTKVLSAYAKSQVEEEMKKNGLVKEDARDRTKWRGVVLGEDYGHTKFNQLR